MLREFKSMYHSDLTPKSPQELADDLDKKRKDFHLDSERASRPWNLYKITKKRPQVVVPDMDYLRQNTQYTDRQIRKRYIGFMSDCPCGYLEHETMVTMYSSLMPESEALAYTNEVFRIFDADGDGRVSFTEYMMATDMTSKGTPIEKLKWAFKFYDKDNNGSIDMQEMVEAIHTLYSLGSCELTGKSLLKRAKAIFDSLDADSDGRITQQEFVQGCLRDKTLVDLLKPLKHRMKAEKELAARKEGQVKLEEEEEEAEEEEDDGRDDKLARPDLRKSKSYVISSS